VSFSSLVEHIFKRLQDKRPGCVFPWFF
jgi:hypothetical protein